MQFVKKIQLTNIKSQQFREQYTSENTSRPSNTSRVHQNKQKRFKRNKPNNTNHSKSSSNCSESNSISKFYVKNISSLIPAEIISNESSVKNMLPKQGQITSPKSPRNSMRNPLNVYGLIKQTESKQLGKDRKQIKKKDSNIDISNFLRRQFSPPTIQKNQTEQSQQRKSIKGGINAIEDAYNFLTPTNKRSYGIVEENKNNKDPKSLLQQLAKQRNKYAEINLELQKSKNNQKKLNLLNQQLDLKSKRLNEKINSLEQQLSKSTMNNVKLKQENHRMKVLVKQRDSLMTTLMQKDKTGFNKKQGSHMKSPRQNNESLVSKIIQFQYENEKLRDTIYKLKKQLQQHQYQPSSSRLLNSAFGQNLSQHPSMISSQITWDDRQFTDCLEQKDKQIIQLREEIKNLQIQINYINRKWINEVERTRKIQKLQWMKLKDKYKDLLIKYKQNMKMNIVLPPCRDQVNRIKKQKKRLDSSLKDQENHNINPESPKRRKRNYTVQHLKGRGVMSDIRINYGVTKTGHPSDQTADLELLQYSSCEDEFVL